MKISLRFLSIFVHALGVLSPIWVSLCGVIFGLGALLAYLEGLPLRDGWYFAWVTALTVGYGDLVMERELSRLCALAIALAGIIFSGIWVAIAVQTVRVVFHVQEDSHPSRQADRPPD